MKGIIAMKNELMETNNTGFLALQDFDLANVMSEEMDGLSATFERVKIPSGGGIMFEIPGDNPDEPETVKEFSPVCWDIPHKHPILTKSNFLLSTMICISLSCRISTKDMKS